MILLHADAHIFFGGGAVVGVVVAVRQSCIAVIPGVGATDRATVLATVTVVQAVLAAVVVGVFSGALTTAVGMAGNAQVVELAGTGVQMQGEGAVAGFQLAGAAAGGVGAAVAQLTGAVNAFDGFGGNAVVEAVDHAANGISTVEQRCRAANDFNTVGVDRVQRYGVVVGQRGSVQCAHAVTQHADTVAIQAADDRPAGAGSEVGRRHPRLLVQGFTQAAFLLQGQAIPFQHGAGRGKLGAAQRVGGDYLRLQVDGVGGGGDEQGSGEGRQPSKRGAGGDNGHPSGP